MHQIAIKSILQQLQTAPSEERQKLARMLMSAYRYAPVSETEKVQMQAILTLILDDENIAVRCALSKAVARLTDVPRQLVLTLANDVLEVAAPILQHSTLLIDTELADMVVTGCKNKQKLIAKRKNLGPKAINKLADKGTESAVEALLSTHSDKISQSDLRRIVERFHHTESIGRAVIRIHDIPIDLHFDVLMSLTLNLPELREAREELTQARFENLASELTERALIHLIEESNDHDLMILATHIKNKGMMTPVFLMRVLASGYTNFCMHAFHILTQLPHKRILDIMRLSNQSTFYSMLKKAQLPESIFKPFYCAVRILHQDGHLEHANNKYWLITRIIEEISKECSADSSDDVSLILTMLYKYQVEESRIASREYISVLAKPEHETRQLPAA